MKSSNNQEFRTVNRILGSQPNLGPVPGNMVLPWTVILLFSYILGTKLFALGWLNTILMAAWLMGTWWILTGKHSWRFLAKFIPLPYVARGHARYISHFERKSNERKGQKKANQKRRRKGKSPKAL